MSDGYIIINFSGETDPRSLKLFTSQNRFIPNTRPYAKAAERMQAATKIWLEKHPQIKLRAAASTYNCMGLVFANRRTAIDPEQWPLIRDDDGYREVGSREEPCPGDIVLYRDDTRVLVHVAVIMSVAPNLVQATWEIEVMSQWGQDGEYIHKIKDVAPPLGNPAEIWTERATP